MQMHCLLIKWAKEFNEQRKKTIDAHKLVLNLSQNK